MSVLFDIDASNIGVMRDNRWLIRNIAWQVPAGECVAIVGPNGSGKSTFAKTLCGYIYPTRGDLTVLGQRFGESDLNHLRESVRLVQATASIEIDTEQTVEELVLTGFFGSLQLYRDVTPAMLREAKKRIRQIGLSKVSDHPIRTLSSGERVRAWIARSLVTKPGLLILDEPTAGLDVVAREQVLATIEKLHAAKGHRPTIVIITHHLEELPSVTSQVMLLREGKIAAIGKPRDVLRSDVISKAYRYPLKVTRRGGRFFVHG
ncbi:ATP-binding cassette domain-containing protein [soil metagenome]